MFIQAVFQTKITLAAAAEIQAKVVIRQSVRRDACVYIYIYVGRQAA